MPKKLLSMFGLSGSAPEAQGESTTPKVLTDVSILDLTEFQQCQLVDMRWSEGQTVYDTVKSTYDTNLKIYQNKPSWINSLPVRRAKLRANRIFSDMEAVINALIANPPKPQFIPSRDTPEAKALAAAEETYFNKKYADLNIKEVMRKGLRNLYFGRLIVVKVFWDSTLNDFNARAIDPRKIRISPTATKEQDSEYCIEEVEDYLLSVMRRFPNSAEKLAAAVGYRDPSQILIDNPKFTYQEAWVRDYVLFKYENIILGITQNPYWDWDGLLVTPQEEETLKDLGGEQRRMAMFQIRAQQDQRQTEQAQQQAQQHETQEEGENGAMPLGDYQDIPQSYNAYYFNHFDAPRKPYIWGTAFNNENTPVGQTDMITQAAPLQEGIDRRKQDIDENASLVNGQVKVDSTVMDKADAQKLRYEARGVIWGKGAVQGVAREMGNALPAFVYEDMQDSRSEIDVIMAASSALRGEREGQETKAGRLALVDQSYMRLNEYVQVVDYVNYEMFNWFYQLAKVRYTEHHYAKSMGEQEAMQIISLIQDDFEDGAEVRVIAGKTLPEDREFRYEQAQQDVKEGLISPVEYLTIAGYNNPQATAKAAFLYKVDPFNSVGLTEQEKKSIPPPVPASQLRETIAFDDLPDAAKPQWLARMGITIQPQDVASVGDAPISIAFKDLPPDGQVQAAAKAGIQLNPAIVVAEKMQQNKMEQEKHQLSLQPPEPPPGSVKSPVKVTKK